MTIESVNESAHTEAGNVASGPVLVAYDVERSYLQGNESLPVLRGVNLQVEAGEKLAIVG